MKKFNSLSDVARHFGVSKQEVKRWKNAGCEALATRNQPHDIVRVEQWVVENGIRVKADIDAPVAPIQSTSPNFQQPAAQHPIDHHRNSRAISIPDAQAIVVHLGFLFTYVFCALWMWRYRDFESALAFVTALGAFFVNVVWGALESETQKEKDEARRKWRQNKLKLFLIATCLAALCAYITDHFYPVKSRTSPQIELAWYDRHHDEFVPFKEFRIQTDALVAMRMGLSLPIELGYKNLEDEALEVDKLVIYYPQTLKVMASGKKRHTRHSNSLIYEHDLGTLIPVDYPRAMDFKDEIGINNLFDRRQIVVEDDDGVPTLELTIALKDEFKTGWEFSIQLFVNGRPELKRKASIRIQAPDKRLTDLHEATPVSLTAADRELFSLVPQNQRVFFRLKGKLAGTNTAYEYVRTEVEEMIQQRIACRGQLRKLVVDSDKDGLINYVLVDRTGDGAPDTKYQFDEPWPIKDWSVEPPPSS